ncbi:MULTISPECIES: dihydroxyacetone kinase subunit DhaL [unclassified Gilliamella]|uniref:dihydroxyacetone kinase subunit DhaL n=1 Tax=unclassified Gilliamella TaxID=2685620 RepID=UPI000A33E8ED|nr:MULTISPECIES: dihydroxyacetone kinase subunit DhaL [unclassified Gilliamella]OTQ75478.1 dihydroxyacetone kinase subunit L [Gilliamella sp. N-G2]OTQ80716.1 dihydroxyacetone kinase subunit L [Gilliamella sp. N-W3]
MLDTKNVLNWLNDFADVIQKNKTYLSELDTPIGDGDHGNNMNRGVIAMQTEFAKTSPNTISDVFRITAMALMGNIGGASGPLYGSAFMEMAKAAKETNELPTIIQAGLNGIIKRGKAVCGEKTMVDVWAPVSKSLLENQLTQQVIDSAVESTKPMMATKGRASYLAQRSIDHLDPGSVSSGFLFTAMLRNIL